MLLFLLSVSLPILTTSLFILRFLLQQLKVYPIALSNYGLHLDPITHAKPALHLLNHTTLFVIFQFRNATKIIEQQVAQPESGVNFTLQHRQAVCFFASQRL